VPLVGPVITAPGTPMGPGGVLGPGGPGVGPVSGQDLRACIANPAACPAVVLGSTVYSQLAPIIDQYIQFLENQGNGRWQGIPDQIKAVIASQYPPINLDRVRYAENINTVHGAAITIGYDIFIPRNIDLTDGTDRNLIFHELEHVVQYQLRGGVRPFLAEYLAKIPWLVINRRSFSIHDFIDIEQAAIAKSNIVSQYFDTYGTQQQTSYPNQQQPPPPPPQAAFTCVTQVGACQMQVPIWSGMSCFCSGPAGNFQGFAQ
jgi:Domain of unknown function (DUF4157)